MSKQLKQPYELSIWEDTREVFPPQGIRYIRDSLRGSNSNAGNYWVQLQVFNMNGTDVARGITPISSITPKDESNSKPLSGWTNGTSTAAPYIVIPGTSGQWQFLQLDLGKAMNDISQINIKHYYSDNRSFNHKLEISSDGSNWYTIFNSDIEGTYPEQPEGKTYDMTPKEVFTDNKVLTFGSDTLETPAKAFNISLKKNINGVKTLSFNLFRKYRDETGELVDNPYLALLSNESRIKLRVGKNPLSGTDGINYNLLDGTTSAARNIDVNVNIGTIANVPFSSLGITPGQNITLSFYVTSRNGKTLKARIEHYNSLEDRVNVYSQNSIKDGEGYLNVTAPVLAGYERIRLLVDANDDPTPETVTESIKEVKLENGNTATPWTLSLPEIAEQEDEEDQWIDFLIKTVDEDKVSYTNTYTASELFVTELGKNGYSVLLDTELENNYGTINELAKKVLEGSGWKVAENSYSPTEVVAQPLFQCILGSALTVRVGNSQNASNTITIAAGETIYPLYNSVERNAADTAWQFVSGEIQLLYKGAGLKFTVNDADDNRLIVDDDLKYNYFVLARPTISGSIVMTGLNGEEALQGNGIVKTTESHYDPRVENYVSMYNINNAGAGRPVNTVAYGYKETQYITSDIVQNYLTNSTNFTSTLAWLPQGTAVSPYTAVLPYPSSTNPDEWLNSNPTNYLMLPTTIGVQRTFYNEGPYSNRLALIKDNIYVARMKMRKIRKNVTDYGTNGSNIYDKATGTFGVQLGTYSPSQGFAAKTSSGSLRLSDEQVSSSTDVNIRGYGIPQPRKRFSDIGLNTTQVDEESYSYVYIRASDSTRASLDRLHLRIDTLTNLNNYDFAIADIQVFDYVEDADGVPIFPGDIPKSEVKFNPKFYYINDADEPIYLSSNESYYTPVYKDGYQSVRHIDIRESNYFNNITSLSELFEVWVNFKIRHSKNGKIMVDGNGDPIKEVQFSKYAPNGDAYNWSGFKYGVNLNSIKRNIDSSSIATKVIVKNNNQKFAKDGTASIIRAVDNPSGENEIYNFNYFVNQGLLGYTDMLADLYGTASGSGITTGPNPFYTTGIRYIRDSVNGSSMNTGDHWIQLQVFNTSGTDIARGILPTSSTALRATGPEHKSITGWTDGTFTTTPYIQTVMSGWQYLQLDLGRVRNDISSINIKHFYGDNRRYNHKFEVSTDGVNWRTVFDSGVSGTYAEVGAGKTYTVINSNKTNNLALLTNLKILNNRYNSLAELLQGYITEIKVSESNVELYQESVDAVTVTISQERFLYDSFSPNDKTRREQKKAVITQLNAQLISFTTALEAFRNRVREYEALRDDAQAQIDSILEQKRALKSVFYKKYYRFIQEGTWSDDQYIDDNLYYLDGVKVASSSAFPSVSYQLGVIDVESVDGFEPYKFEIGNRTYIEDTEFFGYIYKNITGIGSVKTPYKMEVIVSETNQVLDDPSRSTITIQNYKNQFEDLFSKIMATTTQLQYQSGAYNRAAEAITPDGELNITTLEKAIANNSFILSSSTNEGVIIDERGIELIDNTNSSLRLRLTSRGITMSTDGGRTWINGITGDGINTRYLLAGQIDASKINIIANGVQVFRWDAEGLSAFYNEGANYDATRFVRFNQFGLFGTTNGLDLEVALAAATTYQEKLDAVRENSNFSLTWDGLYLQSQDGAVSLDPVGGLEIFNPNWYFPQDTITNYPYTTKPDGVSLYQTTDRIPVVSLGRFFDSPNGEAYYGMRMRNQAGHVTLRTESAGNLWLLNELTVGSKELVIENEGAEGYYRFLGIDGSLPDATGSNNELENRPVLYAGNPINNQSPFKVYGDGRLEATSANISGIINAESGHFSGNITVGDLSGINGDASAQYAFWAGMVDGLPQFYVTPDGKLYANDATINGNGTFTGSIYADNGYFNGEIIAQSGRFEGLLYFGSDLTSYIGVNPGSDLFINIQNSRFGVGNNGDVYADSLMLVKNVNWSSATNRWQQYNILIGNMGDPAYVMEIFNSSTTAAQEARVFGIKNDGSVVINGTLQTDGDLIFAGALRSMSGIMRIDGNRGSISVKIPDVNGWGIYEDGSAYFSNVTVRGKISSAIFEYDNKTSVGGEMLISPSIYLLEDIAPTSTGTTMTYSLSSTYLNETWNNVNRVIVNINGIEIEGTFAYPVLSLDQADLNSITSLEGTSLPAGTQIISISTEVNSITLSAKDPKGSFISVRGPKNQMQGNTFYTTGIRYIRDWLNGSTANTGNHWIQLQVFNENGTDIARGILPTKSEGTLSDGTSNKPLSGWTDGTSATTPYISIASGLRYLQLDLGRIRTDISAINTKHYYADSRRYNHKFEVSMDGEVWYTVFDSAVSGAYAETSTGKTYNVIPSEQSAVLLGNLISTQLPTTSIDLFGENLGYGLYADNVYLTGKLYLPNAGITDENRYYNNEVSDGKQVRFWAGNPSSGMENAPFVVTQDGSLYAMQGTFEGQIIAENSRFSGYLIATGVLIDPNELSDHFFVTNPFAPADQPNPETYIIDINNDGLHIWQGGLQIYSDYYAGWRGSSKTGTRNTYYGYHATSNPNPWAIFSTLDESTVNGFVPRFSTVHQHVWFREDATRASSSRINPGFIDFSRLENVTSATNYNNLEAQLWDSASQLRVGVITVNSTRRTGIQGDKIEFSNNQVSALVIEPQTTSLLPGTMQNTSITTVQGLFNFGTVVQVSQETDGIVFSYIGNA